MPEVGTSVGVINRRGQKEISHRQGLAEAEAGDNFPRVSIHTRRTVRRK
jgi:hypothetical protein